eukprot:NODE_2378_length_794_cov_182.804027_g1654_i0.p7 GENE.NODE_2378_length_794_cov_182.804027_g1654_i0~~NODE_2378_length_794_cov_182.804027_g1654_i0.p7  ORF type:complete len:51 (-),score=18.18 NODE_2378_length_794_cov_182.804027_g1654_i0:640-765(-)
MHQIRKGLRMVRTHWVTFLSLAAAAYVLMALWLMDLRMADW